MTPTTAVAAPPTKAVATIKDRLASDAFKQAVAQALPKHLTPERMIRTALTAMTRTPKLAECDQASFFSALMTLSQLGLEPDGRLAHLIPFNNRKRGCVECQLIVDYKGLVQLAMRSGMVSYVHADVVCENDRFTFINGKVEHEPNFRQDRGAVFAVYAIARFKDGGEKAEAMSVKEVDAVRRRSRSAQDGPWVTDWNEMAKKTVFRRLSKWLPLSPEFRDALDAEPEPEVQVDVSAPSFLIPEQPAIDIAEPQDSPQSKLAALVTGMGYTFDDFSAVMDELGVVEGAYGFAGLKDETASQFLGMAKLKELLAQGKGGAK